MKEIQYRERRCDCCGDDNMEEIWNYSHTCKTRNNTCHWKVRNVVCRNCGFAFVSPVPTDDSLEEYYRDSLSTFSGQQIDYSIENRLNIIRRCQNDISAENYLEIGSNDCPEFISKISAMFRKIETVELIDDCNSTYNHLNNIPKESADIIASYFVLEHVPNPNEFLLLSANALRIGGILIIEVPNLYRYPQDPNGLFLYEHVNHFSPVSLSYLTSRYGLNLMDVSQINCSRSFGFVAILKKTGIPGDSLFSRQNKIEFIQARSCMLEGQQVIKSFHARLDTARKMIGKAGNNVIIWGANHVCSLLLQDYQMPLSSIIVDSDPRKANFVFPSKVYQPKDVLTQIKEAELFVINTMRHAEDIKEWIAESTGRPVPEGKIFVLDYLTI